MTCFAVDPGPWLPRQRVSALILNPSHWGIRLHQSCVQLDSTGLGVADASTHWKWHLLRDKLGRALARPLSTSTLGTFRTWPENLLWEGALACAQDCCHTRANSVAPLWGSLYCESP